MNAQNSVQAVNAMHKVSKGETLWSISQRYNITVEELIASNPEIKENNGKIKKGSFLFIPQPSATSSAPIETNEPAPVIDMPTKKTRESARIGVLLPLEEKTERTKKVIEFYQGFLMAADSVRRQGLDMDIYTYNSGTTEAEIMDILMKPEMSSLDIIFGPVYEEQLPMTANFCRQHGIKLVLPFINSMNIIGNPNIYVVTPSNQITTTEAAALTVKVHADKNVIIIRSNDENTKGSLFTKTLSEMFMKKGNMPRIVNIDADDFTLETAMNQYKDNLILTDNNTIRTLNILVSKLNEFMRKHPAYNISLLGYPEWQSYTSTQLENFFRLDTYIYSAYFYNALSPETKAFEQSFMKNFGRAMINSQPRFAMMGFDLAYWFLHDLYTEFKGFDTQQRIIPYQNPFRFVQEADESGYNNRFVQLIHYTQTRQIETVK